MERFVELIRRKIMYSRELIFEYENVLTENKAVINPFLFNRGDYENERKALYIIKYAIKTYLRWNPFEVRDHMTHRILKMLKLEPLLRYISFPAVIDITKDRDLFYLAVKLYPSLIKYNEEDLILRVYKRVLSGDLQRFPKQFLVGADGLYRAKLCFHYMLTQYMTFSSVKEMYQFFTTRKGAMELRKYRLAQVSRDLFECNIDFLHESLSENQKDELLYHYYRFMINYEKRGN